MATGRELLRDAFAYALLKVCQEQGIQVYYRAPNAATEDQVLIWVMPDSQVIRSGDHVGMDSALSTKKFNIPRQTGLTAIEPKAEIVIGGAGASDSDDDVYSIDEFEEDALGSNWVVTATRRQPRSIGVSA